MKKRRPPLKMCPKYEIFLFFFQVNQVGGTIGAAIMTCYRMNFMAKYHIPQPQSIRKIDGSFAWLDHRLMKNGFIEVLTADDLLLYVFLVLVADRNGVSFYRKETICQKISLDFHQFEIARDRLISMRLIAFEAYSICSPNGHYQILPIRGSPPDFRSQITLPGVDSK